MDHLDKRSYDRRILWSALLAGLPGGIVALCLLWFEDHSDKVRWTFTILIAVFWLGFSFSLRDRVIRPLQTISNLLAALREGDYSIRARGARSDDSLAEVMREVNALGSTLRDQRLDALEATALLRTVMAEINVSIFAFDADQVLRLVNRAGARLLNQPVERLIGKAARDLGLDDCLADGAPETIERTFPGGSGRWGVRRNTFRQTGAPHQLLVIADLSRALREEERLAWQRLIRVLGHELNNSLAPIKSIAASLESILGSASRADDWEDDMRRGLAVIGSRSEALSRFMAGYARLARLPAPVVRPVDVLAWVKRVSLLETRIPVEIVEGPNMTIHADGDQLDQALINLVRNAVDVVLDDGGSVWVRWSLRSHVLEVAVEDNGPGISNPTNLFVPFFTTKPQGSGIGLVLSRQIVEGHGGTLSLENRSDGPGCVAYLRLPA